MEEGSKFVSAACHVCKRKLGAPCNVFISHHSCFCLPDYCTAVDLAPFFCSGAKYDRAQLKDLHKILYNQDHALLKHPGAVFYVIVCRVTLGYTLATEDGQKTVGGNPPRELFAMGGNNRRELSSMPGVTTPAHALQVRSGRSRKHGKLLS